MQKIAGLFLGHRIGLSNIYKYILFISYQLYIIQTGETGEREREEREGGKEREKKVKRERERAQVQVRAGRSTPEKFCFSKKLVKSLSGK